MQLMVPTPRLIEAVRALLALAGEERIPVEQLLELLPEYDQQEVRLTAALLRRSGAA